MIRIVDDFWANHKEYERLLKRCFYYIYSRFPDPDGTQNSYHDLLMQLMSMDVFHRFDASRHAPGAVDTKFEQFMFMWIQKVLEDAYRARGKRAARFFPTNCEDIHKESLYIKNLCQELEPIQRKKELVARKETGDARGLKFYPSYQDMDDYISDPNIDPIDSMGAEETISQIMWRLKNDTERKVLKMMLMHCEVAEIATSTGFSKAYIHHIIKKIRGLYTRVNKQAVVC